MQKSLVAVLGSVILGCATPKYSEYNNLEQDVFYKDKIVVKKPFRIYELAKKFGYKQRTKNIVDVCDEYVYDGKFSNNSIKIFLRDCTATRDQPDILGVESGYYSLLFVGIPDEREMFLYSGRIKGLFIYDLNKGLVDFDLEGLKKYSISILDKLNNEAEREFSGKVR